MHVEENPRQADKRRHNEQRHPKTRQKIPKRRGGCIWTKRVNKVHPPLNHGDIATIKSTPQTIKDLNSVSTFVQVS